MSASTSASDAADLLRRNVSVPTRTVRAKMTRDFACSARALIKVVGPHTIYHSNQGTFSFNVPLWASNEVGCNYLLRRTTFLIFSKNNGSAMPPIELGSIFSSEHNGST